MDNDELRRLARRRTRARIGLLIHATVFVLVNGLLLAIQQLATPGLAWSLFAAAGWGLGLAIHAASVILAGEGAALRERMEAAELRRLEARRGRRIQ